MVRSLTLIFVSEEPAPIVRMLFSIAANPDAITANTKRGRDDAQAHFQITKGCVSSPRHCHIGTMGKAV